MHDARGRARRQVLFYNVFRFVFFVALSRLNLQSKCRQKRTCGRVESGLSLSLFARYKGKERKSAERMPLFLGFVSRRLRRFE